jgi:hypothetical protein
MNVPVSVTSSSTAIRTFISRVFIYRTQKKMFTARIEPDVFITQVNDIKAKLTCQIVLLTLYHHVTPRSEFQGGRRFSTCTAGRKFEDKACRKT